MLDRIKNALRIIGSADYGRFSGRAAELAATSGKNRWFVLADALWCVIRHQAGLTDYFMFDFHKRNGRERASYVTRRKNLQLVRHMNDPARARIFSSKSLFARKFESFLGRDYLLIDDLAEGELERWQASKEVFFAKPDDLFAGVGIERLKSADFGSAGELRKYLLEKNIAIIEESIKQHEDLVRLHPNSVNTIRVITLRKGDEFDMAGAILKCGNGDVVDNMNSGGLSAAIDAVSGRVCTKAVAKMGGRFEAHPLTGQRILGFAVPYWDEITRLAEDVSKVVPEVGFVGWDIAVTPDGPIIVEGNENPGYDIWQIPDERGKAHFFKKYLAL